MSKENEFIEKLVHVNRITKVVKGGRRFGFSALVVVGNQSGKIGIAHAKSKQVPDAIKKANEIARRNLIQIPLREGRTIHHDVKAKDGHLLLLHHDAVSYTHLTLPTILLV